MKEVSAGCCVFYCWALKESHRYIALYRHYNNSLSRSARVVLIAMSLMLYLFLSGLLMKSSDVIFILLSFEEYS